MARTRSSGPGMYISALVFLGVGFVFFLFMFILFFARVEDAEAKARGAEADLREFVTRTEQESTQVKDVKNSEGQGTVIGKMLDDISELKQLLNGTSDTSMAAINRTKTTLDLSNNLFHLIRRLQEDGDSANTTIARWKQQSENAENDRDRAKLETAELVGKYRELSQKLDALQGQLRSDFEDFRRAVAQQRADLLSQMEQNRTANDIKMEKLRNDNDAKDEVHARDLARIRELMTALKIGQPGGVDPSLTKDGGIDLVVGNQGLVHINLGRKNHILPGMTFEVFNKITGPTRNELGEYRGKATIEVINVQEHSSVARIVRQEERAQAVLRGDVIANLVYDPDMTFKFFIYGDFDLDGRGEATDADRRRVENMVIGWGGEVAPARQPGGDPNPIDFDVDFLVLGRSPALPQEPDADDVDVKKEEAYRRSLRRYKTYNQLILEAKELSIPILNQNRFLTMTGYYRR
jgi:hypothetical protein